MNKANKVWNEIFPLKIGDRVKIVRLYTTIRNFPFTVGQEGTIVSISESRFADTPKGSELPERAMVYQVRIGKKREGSFRREELELKNKVNPR